MTQKDYYMTLGVARDATQDQIKKAYRKMAQTYHPDINKSPNAEAMMKSVNEAYDVLSDPNKKAQYDRFGQTGPTYGSQRQGQPYTQGYTTFDDLFAEMLRQQQRQQQQRRTVYRSRPITVVGLLFRVLYAMFILQIIMNMIMFMFRW